MPQSLAQIYLHIVYSTKHRQPFLTDRALRDEMHAYLAGACANLDAPAIRVGGVDDHVHVLCRFSRTLTVADFIGELKRESSKWIKRKDKSLEGFQWQGGYGAFSISPSHIEGLKTYIGNQEEHRRRETLQEEFLRLLKRYGVEYDERYVWD